MKFKYSFEPREGGVIVGVPIIWIELDSPISGSFSYPCLVDSGADSSTFNSEIGEAMGLNIKNGSPVKLNGIKENAPIQGYIHNITYRIKDVPYQAYVTFADEVGIKDGILGRNGFFNHFIVTIDEKKGEFELIPYETKV